MAGSRVFVDTNVLVYAHNADAGPKHDIAKDRIAELWHEMKGVLSVQVLQELYVNLTRKISAPIDRANARELVRNYASWLAEPTDLDLVLEELHRLSFCDALIVTAAAQAGAGTLLSEDLNDGQVIEGVKIENRFRVT